MDKTRGTNFKKKLGAQIKIARKESNITQKQLAELTELNVTYISFVETGKANVTLDALCKITDALQADVNISLNPKF